MEKLIIDRKKWRTGGDSCYKTGSGPTLLLNDKGYMCCLGFDALRKGLSKKDILNVGEPEDIFDDENDDIRNEKLNKYYGEGFSWTTEAIHINDDGETTPLEKEILLTQVFDEQGIKLTFKN